MPINLPIYTTHNNVRHEQVKQYFVANEVSIKDKITAFLEACDVYNSSSWEDAQVDGGLTVRHLGDIDPSVLYIDNEQSQVTFDIDVEFEVTVEGPDFENGFYDREEGRIFTFGRTSITSTISTTYTTEVFLNYDFCDGAFANAEDSGLYVAGISGGIETSIEENDSDWN